MTVTEAACNDAPDARVPGGVGAVAPGIVVVVVVVVGTAPLVQVGGQVVAVGIDNVNVTGPEVTVVVMAPEELVVQLDVQEELLLNDPGKSGAVQRAEIFFSNSPD